MEAQSSLRDLLMGSGKGQMNLAAVRARAEDLRRTLDQIVQTLHFSPDRIQWADALDKFSVVGVQLGHLREALRPLLRHYVAHPRSVNQANAPVLPIALASRLLPEQEAEDGELLAEAAASGGWQPAAPPEAQLPQLLAQAEALNAVIDSLLVHSGPGTGALDARGPKRREAAARAAKAAGLGRSASAAQLPAAPAGPGGRPGPGGAKRPEQLEGPELLLAAASYGAGLR